jgi:subtilisin-like proprotein convertase family protein
VPIPDADEQGGATGVAVYFNPTSGGVIADLDICVNIDHTRVGDLFVELEHMTTGTTVTLLDRPGVPAIDEFGCQGDDIRVYLDDEALTSVENQCGLGTPSIQGAFKPNSPLIAFDGESIVGQWQLRIFDKAGDSDWKGEVVGSTIFSWSTQ